MIQLCPENCIGCGKCAWDCFPGALQMDKGHPALHDPAACIGCGHCIAVCPQNALYDSGLPQDDVVPTEKNVPPETLLALTRSRRSCRHFTAEPVSREDLDLLLSAARSCPTAKNLQRTRYIAVTKSIPALLDLSLEALGQVGQMQKITNPAPDELRRAENFIRWADQRRSDRSFDPLFFHAPLLLIFVSDKGDPRDAAAAAAYTELMAAALGLGCLYSGYFTACAAGSEKIQAFLGLSPDEQAARCLVLGHPAISFPRTAPRKPVHLTEL